MSAALGERLAVALAVALGLLFLVEGVALRRRGRAAGTPRTGGAAGASRPKATRAETAAAATAAAATAAAATAAPETEPEPETPTRRSVDGPEGDRQAPVARLAAALAPRLARREVVVAAVVVGAALRLAWVVWATRTPTGLRDPAEYLRIAVGLTEGDLPRFGGGGGPSAFWPPGYPALLAPFVWVARETGWASTAFVASLVNVVAGTASVALAGVLAGQWLGRSARAVAAWLVALAPGLVFWTSTPHTETAFTPFLLGALALASAAADRPSTRRWALVGVLAAAAFLVRSPGVIVLAAPALALRGRTGTWRGALRPTLVTVAVAAALLVPWTVRNGVQVGFWSPASTNNAGAVCFGHHDDALPLWEPEKLSQRIQDDCYGTSPYAERRFAELYGLSGAAAEAMPVEVDEAAWYREATGKGVRWALTHPLDELRLDVHKVWETWSSEGRVVDGARNFEDPGWAGRWHGPLEALADWWGWLVGALALAGLATSAACRRALVLWVPIVLYTLAIAGGVVDPHYRYPVVPLVAALAAGALVHVGRRAVGAAPADPPAPAPAGEHGGTMSSLLERAAP